MQRIHFPVRCSHSVVRGELRSKEMTKHCISPSKRQVKCAEES